MKTLADGTNVPAILWYLALEYKDYLLQQGERVHPIHELNSVEFSAFCQKATTTFISFFNKSA